MSGSGSSQRSSTVRADSTSQRMPFEAAEALLWGRKTHRDHEYLFEQMKELQSQHNAYDDRIRATEAIAEAAEAATNQIRHMETQIAAMESDDKDRPFDKWAENAIMQLRLFADNNTNVRQKLNNLEGRFCEAVDNFDRVGGASKDVASLLRRLDVLESERKEDRRRAMLMENEIANLKDLCQMSLTGGLELQTGVVRFQRSNPVHAQTTDDPDVSDATTEEEVIPPSRAPIQVPRSPSINIARPETSMQPSTTKARHSARMNIMRRPSIYDPRIAPANTSVQPQAPASRQRAAPSHPTKTSEETLKTGNKTGKRKREDDHPAQRLTRAKVGEGAKPKQPTAPVVTKKTTTAQSQVAVGDSTKQRLVVAIPIKKPAAALPTPKQAQGPSVARQTKTTKSTNRKPDGPSCKQCRQQHQGCDRARPACGRCAKSSRSGGCEYPDTQSAATQPAARLANIQMNALQQARRPAKLNTHSDATPSGTTPPDTKVGGLKKLKASVAQSNQSNRPSTTKSNSNVKTPQAPKSRRPPRVLPDATDLETFLNL